MKKADKPVRAPDEIRKTSLNLRADVLAKAERYQLDEKHAGRPKSIGNIVSDALDEYLKKRGA